MNGHSLICNLCTDRKGYVSFLCTFADMKIKSSVIVFFSPTGTSRKVAVAVSEGCGYPSRVVDVTYQASDDVLFAPDELVFVAVPVYGGKVAPLALQRMAEMRGNSTPAVPIVVYGNRAYEGALSQLADFFARRGFLTSAIWRMCILPSM